MSDNLKNIEDQVDIDIDPAGAPGSILALNHNEILKDILNSTGKYTGAPYTAKKDESVVPTGIFSWNGNAMNVVTPFVITISKLTIDLNDIGKLLDVMPAKGIIKFKDYVGRSVYLEYISHVAGVDLSANDVYNITVKGFVENPNYIYQNAEQQIAVLEFFIGSAVTHIDTFVATHGQTEYDVQSGSISDNGLWTAQVGSALLNSTTGITSFVNGGISINFAIGKVTFITPLQGGTQVIIKYN